MRHDVGRARSRGVAAVELAVLLPLFIALVGGAYELGRAVWQYQLLCKSVRAAARHLATGDATNTTRQAEARNLVVYGSTQALATPLLPGLRTGMVSLLEPTTTAGVRNVATGAGQLSMVTVSVSGYVYTPELAPFMPAIPFSPVSLTMGYTFF